MRAYTTYKVKCRSCGRYGKIRVMKLVDEEVDYKDLINHNANCPLRKVQPKHLKSKTLWRRGEKQGNALVGATDTAASGALNKDGDGRVINEWRVETKTSRKDSFRLSREVWEKLHIGAMSNMEEPLLFLSIALTKYVMVRNCLVKESFPDYCPKGKSFLIKKDMVSKLPLTVGVWPGSPVLMTEVQFKEIVNEK